MGALDETFAVLPNAFYDFIVFIGSTVVLIAGVFVGLGGVHTLWLKGFDFGTIDALLVVGGVVLLGYEYGRIAEAWSALIVQRPLEFCRRRTRWFKDPDFLARLPLGELERSLPPVAAMRPGNKWTVYLYASVVSPTVGSDLLKRYAWEKLARNSAFSYAILLGVSVVVGVARVLLHKMPATSWTFGTTEYSIALALLAAVTYVEYYKRNCWNNDLLIKALPVLLRAEELLREGESVHLFSGGSDATQGPTFGGLGTRHVSSSRDSGNVRAEQSPSTISNSAEKPRALSDEAEGGVTSKAL